MRGMLRSNRCQRCRRRKIKCDETWPACTPCVRAKAVCSGPPTRAILAGHSHSHSHSHGPVGSYPVVTTAAAVTTVAYAPSTTAFDDSLIYTVFSPPHQRPIHVTRSTGRNDLFSLDSSAGLRAEPTTTADRVAARLISYLTKSSSYDASLAACYLHLLPARLGDSAALRDTVALFCSCWGNFRRSLPSAKLIDARAYGKALRSLQRALDDPRQQLSCETLAATTIMDRVEILFDARRKAGRATHARGIRTLMLQRGPPKYDDELDIHLTLGNQGTLYYSWLLEGDENFLLTPPWKEALHKALAGGKTSAPSLLAEAYWLDTKLEDWPSLLHPVHQVRETSISDPERVPKAITLLEQSLVYDEFFSEHAGKFQQSAMDLGLITAIPDAACVTGARFSFDGFATLRRWMMYTSISVMLNRVMAELTAIVGESRVELDAEHRVLCRQVWMSLQYMLEIGPIAWTIFSTAVTLSFEGADDNEKEYILDVVLEMDRFKGRLPREREPLKELLQLTAMTITGRSASDVGRLSLAV